MMIGCCHCGEEPSESSLPPSVSSDGAIQTVTVPSCPAPRCFSDIAPVRFSVTLIDPGGSTATCQPFYMGTFILYHTSSSCFSYLSTERPGKLSAGSCVNHTSGERFTLNIGGAVFGGNTQFALQAIYNSGGFNSSIANYSLDAGATDINCVNSFILNKTSSDSSGFVFPSTCLIVPV